MLEFAKALPQVLASLNLGDRLREGRLLDLWPDVVGPAIAAQTRPVKCQDGILTVAVSSSAWLQQLTMMRQDIQRLFVQKVGKGAIKEVRFTAHGFAGWPTGDAPPPDPGHRPRSRLGLPPDLPPAQQEKLDEALAVIADEELRTRTARLLAKASLRQDALKAKGWKACRLCGELHDRGRPLCIVCEVSQP